MLDASRRRLPLHCDTSSGRSYPGNRTRLASAGIFAYGPCVDGSGLKRKAGETSSPIIALHCANVARWLDVNYRRNSNRVRAGSANPPCVRSAPRHKCWGRCSSLMLGGELCLNILSVVSSHTHP